jgi:hypothetical protein
MIAGIGVVCTLALAALYGRTERPCSLAGHTTHKGFRGQE